MKKVLFASTALIATAGMAAADLTWSGGARFGVVYNDALATNKTQIHNRFTLNFDGTADTDSGAQFFARIRIRGGNTGPLAPAGTTISAPRVGVRANGFEVAVGNINGAMESTPGLYTHSVGLTGLSWGSLPTNASGAGAFAWDAFSSGGGGSNGVEVIYSANGFGFHLSHSQNNGALTPDRTAFHASYKFSDWTVALAHQESDVAMEDMTLLSVLGSFGNVSVSLAHAWNEGDFDATRLGAGFEVGTGTTVAAYVTLVGNAAQNDAFGIGFNHDLGGATLAGGIENTFADTTRADLGVRFNF